MTAPLTALPAWKDFTQAAQNAFFNSHTVRLIEAAGLTIDLSAQRNSIELEAAAETLLQQKDFDQRRYDLFNGALVNWTENRPAWHTALRAANPPLAIAPVIQFERDRIRQFTQAINAKRQFAHILHFGIGGSDWGSRMAIQALQTYKKERQICFVSNVDAHAIHDVLPTLSPHDTLIIIASKTFKTIEPLTNAQIAINWLRLAGVTDPLAQIVAVTVNEQAALDFGIDSARIFKFWDWVGGRYSIWSAIGLPIALTLGFSVWEELLQGGAAMDEHFLQAPYSHNAPIQMALAGIVNRSVWDYSSLAIIPYDARLIHLIPWAQQLEMESLGKSVTSDGSSISVPISPAVWGLAGTDSQHTFFQWLHQESKGAPIDFILCQHPDHSYIHSHRLLIANCLAQRAALLHGKSFEQAFKETQSFEPDSQKASRLAHHRVHPGGRPSTLIVLPRLTARNLGALLALYEHKVFVQGLIWDINPFDQWGVEFGKSLATHIIDELEHPYSQLNDSDLSTQHWIQTFSMDNIDTRKSL